MNGRMKRVGDTYSGICLCGETLQSPVAASLVRNHFEIPSYQEIKKRH